MATRKRLQKLFALLLVLSMTMGMLNITAFATEGELICDTQEHTHTTACYEQTLICEQQESAGHVHTDACYTLSCDQTEGEGHHHSESCYDAENNLICGLKEGEGNHSHTDACYGLTCEQEESAGHTHTDACYTETLVCSQEEHTHNEACYDAQSGVSSPEEAVLYLEVGKTKSLSSMDWESGYLASEVENSGYQSQREWSVDDTSLVNVTTGSNGKIKGLAAGTTKLTGLRYKVLLDDGTYEYYTNYYKIPGIIGGNPQYCAQTYTWNLTVVEGHMYETTGETEPTCAQAGVKNLICRACGEKATESIPAFHSELAAGEACPVCGKVLFTWDEESKTLTFTADIPTYAQNTYTTRPYQEFADEAERVVLADGVQQVGGYAFAYFTALKAIGPADTLEGIGVLDVNSVGYGAFWNVHGMTSYTFTENVQDMDGCLYNCGELDSVTVHNTPVADAFGFQANEPLAGSTLVTNMVIDDPDGILGKANITSQWDGIINLTVNVKEIQGSASSDDLKTLVVTNAERIGDKWMYDVVWGNNIFPNLTDITLENVGLVGKYAFQNTPVKNVTLRNVQAVGEGGFYYCGDLESVTIENVGLIDAYTFDGCDLLTTLNVPDETKLGYSDIFNKTEFAYLKDRMFAILDGQFALKATPSPETLTVPSGWESSHTGQENAAALNEDQVTKAARWTDEDKTQAEVEFQFNYAKDQGMDFVFVVDYSGSMSKVGNYAAATVPDGSVDDNSRFFDMQSKLLDVSEQLLNTQGYDNRVAFVTFATNATEYLHTQNFTQDYDMAENFVMAYQPYGSTNYAIALDAAYSLIANREDTSREAAVIFISDGKPNRNFAANSSNMEKILPEIEEYADRIKSIQQFGHGTKIFGVMQSVPASEEADCINAMKRLCSDGLFFLASDTQEFSDAINNAIGASYNIYTLVDTIDPAFTLDESSITVSAGTYQVGEDADGNTTITWTITGVPYLTHTMNYDLMLNQVNGSYPYGSFDTNEGDAVVALGADNVNAVATPVLTRERSSSGGGGSSYDYYNVTVNYLDEDGNSIASNHSERIREGLRYDVTAYDAIAIEGYTYDRTTGDPLTGTMNGNKVINVWYVAEDTDITDPEVPGGETPENPDGGDGTEPGTDPGVDIEDPDVPGAEVPETGDISALWLALSALSGTGLAGVTVLGRKKRDEE